MNSCIEHTRLILLSAMLLAVLTSCDDHGLSPVASRPGFGGELRVVSAWSPPDSLFDLRVVAFPEYPPDNILLLVAEGKALISDPLEYNLETQRYDIFAEGTAGTFEYIVVVQRYGPSLQEDWRVVGVYAQDEDVTKPASIELNGSSYVPNINMNVDFYNPPPQPF